MKLKKFDRKLAFNKETISNLNSRDLNKLRGGATIPYTCCDTCDPHATCIQTCAITCDCFTNGATCTCNQRICP